MYTALFGDRFITHDDGVHVYNHMSPIKIGNNVFVGAGTYIMPGGNNWKHCCHRGEVVSYKEYTGQLCR